MEIEFSNKRGDRLRNLWQKRVVRLAAVGLVVLLIAGVGIFIFIQHRNATPEYALQRLNRAIAERNVAELAKRVDFVQLSQKLALAIAERRGVEFSGHLGDLQLDIQRRLLKIMEETPEVETPEGRLPPGFVVPEKPKSPLDAPVFDIVKKPTHILPPDVLEQLTARPFVMKAEQNGVAVLETTIMHPQLEREFTVQLLLSDTPQGWIVTEVANGRHLVESFFQKVNLLVHDAKEAFDAENARVTALMNTYYHITQCRPILFPPNADNVVRLRIVLTGKNTGDRETLSSASLCTLHDQNGASIGTLRLENVRSVAPGADFEHAWFYNFETRYPEVDAMVAARSLTCTAEPTLVSLGRANMLFPRKLEDWPGVHYAE